MYDWSLLGLKQRDLAEAERPDCADVFSLTFLQILLLPDQMFKNTRHIKALWESGLDTAALSAQCLHADV